MCKCVECVKPMPMLANLSTQVRECSRFAAMLTGLSAQVPEELRDTERFNLESKRVLPYVLRSQLACAYCPSKRCLMYSILSALSGNCFSLGMTTRSLNKPAMAVVSEISCSEGVRRQGLHKPHLSLYHSWQKYRRLLAKMRGKTSESEAK